MTEKKTNFRRAAQVLEDLKTFQVITDETQMLSFAEKNDDGAEFFKITMYRLGGSQIGAVEYAFRTEFTQGEAKVTIDGTTVYIRVLG